MKRCADCNFFVKLGLNGMECRVDPIKVLMAQTGAGQVAPIPYFPVTREDLWCGKFEPSLLGLQPK